jgi:uncharacterized repeat protein (TIGR03803 family)
MTVPSWICKLNCKASFRPAIAVLAATTVFALAAVLAPSAQAQTYSVIHFFPGSDGNENPTAGVTIDHAGRLYGTTYNIWGSVFEMRTVDSKWLFSTLLQLPADGEKGLKPQGGVVKGPDGNLYGTTVGGGGSCACGVVFKLQPPPTAPPSAVALWTETVLYEFKGDPDGSYPGYGNLVFDPAGNLYGTTEQGGVFGQGAVFELSPGSGGWTESVIYSFSGFDDGGTPYGGLTFDDAGNFYGTTTKGGQWGGGTAFELTAANGGWTETVLHSFQGLDGTQPEGTLIFDASGNIYGTAYFGGLNSEDGSVFELSPSNGGWTFSVLHLFDFSAGEGADPVAGVTMGSDGNLYGTTLGGGAGDNGTIFRLVNAGGSWTYQTLHSFFVEFGAAPFGGVTFDSQGNMYGTTITGGQGLTYCAGGCGLVWKMTP